MRGRSDSTGTEKKPVEEMIGGFDDRFEKLVEEISAVVKPRDVILDIGCGEGKLWQMFGDNDVWGLDFSKKNLKKAKRFLEPVCGDAEELPFTSDSFDLVVASDVLEHLLGPERTLVEIGRVLRSGGKAIITFPNVGGIQIWLSLLLWGRNPSLNYPENKHHLRFFGLADIGKMIEGTALEIEKVRGSSFLSFGKENFGAYMPIPRRIRVWGGDLFPRFSKGYLAVLEKR